MLINPSVAVLGLQRDQPDRTLWLSLLLDPDAGPTLVDTGIPGLAAAIAAELAEHGVTVADLKRIILTHHDIDHIGSLHDLVAQSGARTLASAGEAPMIDGRATPRFANPAAWERIPQLREVAALFKPTAGGRDPRGRRAAGWRGAGGGHAGPHARPH